jgi:hypothetical protein
MTNLINSFRELIGKDSNLGQESKWMPSFNSGIDVFDYRNGRYEDDGISTGIDGGKIITLIGKSGTGKSTFGLQMGINIANQFEESQLIHLDFERATNDARITTLSGWSKEELKNKYIHMNSGISTETVFALIKSLAKLKKEKRKELEYDTGKTDNNNNPVMALPPSVVLLDSLAVMAPDKIEEDEEMSGQMSATAIAKANTQLFKRIMSPLMDANIILIVINHINQKVDINPMMKTQAQVNFLKQDETLPGKICLEV